MKLILQHSILCCALIVVFSGQAQATEQSIVNTTKSNTKDLVTDAVQTEPTSPDTQQQINKTKSNVKNNKQASDEPENSAAKPDTTAKGINEAGIK